jgi:hypothetical protein
MLKREYIAKAWRDSGTISQSPPDWALRFAQSIRNAALEEAANVCESLYKGHEWIFETRPQSHACADAVRAMKTKEQS